MTHARWFATKGVVFSCPQAAREILAVPVADDMQRLEITSCPFFAAPT